MTVFRSATLRTFSHNARRIERVNDVFSNNVLITAKITDVLITALADTDSNMNFVSACCAKSLGLPIAPVSNIV